MINFSYLEMIEFLKNEEKERSVISFLDRSNGTFIIGLFHDSEPVNVMSKIMGFTYYGFVTYLTHIIPTKEELSPLMELYKKDITDSNFWWESDEGIPYPDKIVKMAEYLNNELSDDEIEDEFFQDLIKEFSEDTKQEVKPKLTLISNEDTNEEN